MTFDQPESRLRAGIVGAGNWAREAHVPGFLACTDVELAAICDEVLLRADAVASEAGIPRVYPSAGAMLAAEHLDLVSIVTPDDRHRADVEIAIAAGAHVLCEKPLATTLPDARALAVQAASAGVATRVGFAMRYAPAMAMLRDMVFSGELGTPHLLQAFQQNGQFLDPAAPLHWKMQRDRTGGGASVEYGIHTIDLARWIMGEATRVCATSRTWTPERPRPDGGGFAQVDVDDSTAWLTEFASGAIGICHAGWATVGRPPGVEIRVFGSRGAVRCALSDELPGAQGLWRAGPDGIFHPLQPQEPLAPHASDASPWWVRFPARLIHEFVSDILTGDSSGPTFADGVAAQEVLEAVLISVRERRWVDLPLDAAVE